MDGRCFGVKNLDMLYSGKACRLGLSNFRRPSSRGLPLYFIIIKALQVSHYKDPLLKHLVAKASY
jgi:hypothetical protein